LYCEQYVHNRIVRTFDYAFENTKHTHPGAAPKLQPIIIGEDPIEILGATVIPVRLIHGPRFTVLGFRVGNVAYCTDVSKIPPESMDRLRDLDVLVIGALRHSPHPTHLSVPEALAIVDELRPKMTYFTHTSHELDYDETNAALPSNVQLAYDGQRIALT
jgi:phosphoribosyl 1,2-cyclic phosphate phosphodiesterase